MSGNLVLVGSQDDTGVELATGAAYLFRFSGQTWTQIARLLASDGSFADDYGAKGVALDGEYAVVGARGDDDACPENIVCDSGSAYTYWIPAVPECSPIPTLDAWGLGVLSLLILCAGTLVLRQKYGTPLR